MLLSIIISCICHRKGCCKRNGGRQRIYNDNRNEEQQDLTTVDNLNSLSIDMSNLPTSSYYKSRTAQFHPDQLHPAQSNIQLKRFKSLSAIYKNKKEKAQKHQKSWKKNKNCYCCIAEGSKKSSCVIDCQS